MTRRWHEYSCIDLLTLKALALTAGTNLQVYKARWHGTLVAVKALIGESQADAEALQHEAAILEGLHHSHIVHYFDYIIGEDGTVRSLVSSI